MSDLDQAPGTGAPREAQPHRGDILWPTNRASPTPPSPERLAEAHQIVTVVNTHKLAAHIVLDRFNQPHRLAAGESKAIDLPRGDIEEFVTKRAGRSVRDWLGDWIPRQGAILIKDLGDYQEEKRLSREAAAGEVDAAMVEANAEATQKIVDRAVKAALEGERSKRDAEIRAAVEEALTKDRESRTDKPPAAHPAARSRAQQPAS